ncbi:hypothetical protein G7054_g4235 [Neopestalotiopsis clavispora]|nr:hypothetical protein G7054_g4235 [Neopestalotiopsis clavispora]
MPSKKAGIIERFKLKWVATSLFAPELMLYLALTQFLEARWLKLQLQELQRQSKTSRKDFVFDMRYSFFVVMGGLQISYEDIATDWGIFRGAPEERPTAPLRSWNSGAENGQQEDSRLYEDWYERVQQWQEDHHREWNARPYGRDAFNHTRPTRRLSSRGVVDLARLGHFIYIPRETIEDKSKQDTIQKILVVLQVVWMVVQCIARKSYGLPLSLLEVHTMVHVACAIFLYGFWFKKPLDVRTPERMELFLSRDLQALILFETLNDLSDHRYLTVLCPVVDGLCPQLHSFNSDGTTISMKADAAGQRLFRPTVDVGQKLMYDKKVLLHHGDVLPCGVRFIAPEMRDCDPVWLSAGDCEMLSRVVSAVQCIDGQPIQEPQVFRSRISTYAQGENHQTWLQRLFIGSKNDLLTSPFQHGSKDTFLRLLSGRWLSTALLILLPACYGAVHFTAWLTFFPTDSEKILWRFAAGVIVAGCPVFCFISWGHGRWLQLVGSRDYFVINNLIIMWLLCIMLAYIVARIYIVIAVFTSLRRVPIGVYWTPDWVEMLPHL